MLFMVLDSVYKSYNLRPSLLFEYPALSIPMPDYTMRHVDLV